MTSSLTAHDAAAICRRLDLIIQILLESGANSSKTTSAKIKRLLDFGLSPSEAAVIMGKKTSYITAVYYRYQVNHQAHVGTQYQRTNIAGSRWGAGRRASEHVVGTRVQV